MKRFWIVLVLAAVIELSRGYFTPRLEALPVASDGWTLVAQTVLDPVPAELKTWPETSRAVKAWRGTYSGTSPMSITLYAMPWSPGSAWDAIQRWRPGPDTMAFAKGRYFGVAVSPGGRSGHAETLRAKVHGNTSVGAETIR